MSAIPQAITPNPHTNLLNVCIQIANKAGFQPKKITCIENDCNFCKIQFSFPIFDISFLYLYFYIYS
jgi:hypothetical protein